MSEIPDDIITADLMTDAQGNQFYSILTQDKDGHFSTYEVTTTGVKEGAGISGYVITTTEGEDIDITTVEGLKRAAELGATYEELDRLLDEGTKMDKSTREGLLRQAGLTSIEETEEETAEKEKELKLLEGKIAEYKKDWKAGEQWGQEGGDKRAGTREEFINEIYASSDHLSYEEIRDKVYKEVTDDWLKQNQRFYR
jgi:hypothetical protein